MTRRRQTEGRVYQAARSRARRGPIESRSSSAFSHRDQAGSVEVSMAVLDDPRSRRRRERAPLSLDLDPQSLARARRRSAVGEGARRPRPLNAIGGRSRRTEIRVSTHETEPARLRTPDVVGEREICRGLGRRTQGSHPRLLEPAICLAGIAPRARGDAIRPRRRAAVRSRNHVIDGELVARESLPAVLARVAIATEQIPSRERDAGSGVAMAALEKNDLGNTERLRDRLHESRAIDGESRPRREVVRREVVTDAAG